MKPFLTQEIDRYHGAARVRIYLISNMREEAGETKYDRKLLSDYETLSKGAARSAAREKKKYAHLLAS